MVSEAECRQINGRVCNLFVQGGMRGGRPNKMCLTIHQIQDETKLIWGMEGVRHTNNERAVLRTQGGETDREKDRQRETNRRKSF